MRTKAELRLHFDNRRWIAFMTKVAPTELVRTDDLAIGRAAHADQAGLSGQRTRCGPCCAPTSGRRRTGVYPAVLRAEHIFPKAAERHRAAAVHRESPGVQAVVHPGGPGGGRAASSDSQQLYEQAAEQAG